MDESIVIGPRAEEYLGRVEAGLRGLPRAQREEALDELRSHIAEHLGRGEDVQSVLGSLGEPGEYAAAVAEALSEPAEDAEPQGRVLGMPYDFRGPSTQRLMDRLWNPTDPRVFVPRLFGVGWTVNFGAVAVRLGLVRPDDTEADPFRDAPAWSVAAALGVPAVLAIATTLILALSWRDLPAELPVHWGAGGRPDGFAPSAVAVGMLAALGILPVALVYARVLRPGTPKRTKVLYAAALTLLAAVGTGVAAATVIGADGDPAGPWIHGSLVAGFVLSFLVLFVPVRLGLAAEWRRSLGAGGGG